MFLPESTYQYTWLLAPLVSIVLVFLVAVIGNAIVFPAILRNALVKVIVHAPIYFALKIAYLMYRVWPSCWLDLNHGMFWSRPREPVWLHEQ
jgi:hypothetical protein